MGGIQTFQRQIPQGCMLFAMFKDLRRVVSVRETVYAASTKLFVDQN